MIRHCQIREQIGRIELKEKPVGTKVIHKSTLVSTVIQE